MLYGYKHNTDNDIMSLTVAADDYDDFSYFVDTDVEKVEPLNYIKHEIPGLIDMMQNDLFVGYEDKILVTYHDTQEQRQAFFDQWEIKEVKPLTARDRHRDMLYSKKKSIEDKNANWGEVIEVTDEDTGEVVKKKKKKPTIREQYNLDKYDPWDKRSEEEKALDKKRKIQKKGGITGESFGGDDGGNADTGISIQGVRNIGGGSITATAIKGLSGASGASVKIDAKKVPNEVKTEVDPIKLFKMGHPVFIPMNITMSPEKMDKWCDDNCQAWYYRVNNGTYIFNYPEDMKAFDKMLKEFTTDEEDIAETVARIQENANRDGIPADLKKVMGGAVDSNLQELGKNIGQPQKNDKKPQPVPQDFRFQLNPVHTKSNAVGGIGIPVFNVAGDPQGPAKGKWSLMYVYKLMAEVDPLLDMVSEGLVAYDGPLTNSEIQNKLEDAGFRYDSNLLNDIKKQVQNDLNSLRGEHQDTVTHVVNDPAVWARVLAGDGTSTASGTGSFGYKVTGMSETDRKTVSQTAKGPTLDTYKHLRETTLEKFGKQNDDSEEDKEFAALIRSMHRADIAGKKLRVGPYQGMTLPGNRYIIPEVKDKSTIIFDYNMCHLGATVFDDVTLHQFIVDKETVYGFVGLEREITEKLTIEGKEVERQVKEVCLITFRKK